MVNGLYRMRILLFLLLCTYRKGIPKLIKNGKFPKKYSPKCTKILGISITRRMYVCVGRIGIPQKKMSHLYGLTFKGMVLSFKMYIYDVYDNHSTRKWIISTATMMILHPQLLIYRFYIIPEEILSLYSLKVPPFPYQFMFVLQNTERNHLWIALGGYSAHIQCRISTRTKDKKYYSKI